jgi:hypothetical protein
MLYQKKLKLNCCGSLGAQSFIFPLNDGGEYNICKLLKTGNMTKSGS